jgi:selenocysteine-specific elongation factor
MTLDPAALREAVRLLIGEKILEKISEDLALHSGKLDPLREKIKDFINSQGKMSMQDFKELSGLSRKYTIPLMEYFDRSGFTIRVGDHRVLRKSS